MTADSGHVQRRPHIQGLRAVAVLLVLLHHAAVPGAESGFIGVDVFFTISGFVITLGLLRELAATGRVDLKQFCLRRFRRLGPALAAMLAVTLLLGAVLLSPVVTQRTAAATGVGATILAANAVIARASAGYFGAKAHLNPFLHTWSLAVEEQFYVVFPLLLSGAWATAVGLRRRAERRVGRVLWLDAAAAPVQTASGGAGATLVADRAAPAHSDPVAPASGPASDPAPDRAWRGSGLAGCVAALVTVTFLSFSMALLQGLSVWSLPKESFLGGFYGPLPRFWEFGVGALVAVWAHQRGTERVPAWRRAALVAAVGVALLVAACLTITPHTPFPGPATLLPVAATACLITAGEWAPLTSVARMLAWRPLRGVGDMSYALYLWHWPGVVFARAVWPQWDLAAVAGTVLSLPCAVAAYRFVEVRFRRTPPHATIRGVAPLVAATTGTVWVLAAALAGGAHVGYGSSVVRQFAADVAADHLAHRAACDTGIPPAARPPGACTWLPGRAHRAYLFGDSHADALSDSLIRVAEPRDTTVTALLAMQCPVVYPDGWHDPDVGPTQAANCERFVADTLTWLDTAPQGTVFIATSSVYWVTPGPHTAGVAERDVDAPRAAQAYTVALRRTLARLRAAGHAVVVIDTVPTYWFQPYVHDPRACPAFRVFAGTCRTEMPHADYERRQGFLRDVTEVETQAAGARSIHAADAVCDNGMCATGAAGRAWYRDPDHLTTLAAARLDPALAAALDSTP